MKKLNITKDRFTESKYFQEKYGTLEYVSESGNVYKTSKGNLIQFKEMAINKDRFSSSRTDKEILALTKKLDAIRSCLQNVVDFVKEMSAMPDKNTGTDEEWAEYEENKELLKKLFEYDVQIPLNGSTEVRLASDYSFDAEQLVNGLYVWVEYDWCGWYLRVDEKTQNVPTEWKQLEDSELELPSGTSKEIAKFIVANMSEHTNLRTLSYDLMTMPDNALEEKFNDKIDKLSDDEELN